MRSPLRLLAALGATAVLAATPIATAGATTAGDPTAGRPALGECHALTLTQAKAETDSTAPVDCAGAHTSRIVAVRQLPAALDWSSPANQLARAVLRGCHPAYDAALGTGYRTRDSSAHTPLIFSPTDEQRSQGARWFSCSVTLTAGTRLMNLPTDAVPAITGTPLPDSTARCLTATEYRETVCARPHGWRVTGTFTLDSATYPGTKRLRAAAARGCISRVHSNRFVWDNRNAVEWKLGDHVIVCFSRTRA